MRRFQLERDVDATGISGIGLVAWGVLFPDGKVITRWNGKIAQVSVWESIDDVRAIHGHSGHTRIVWIDDVEPSPQLKLFGAELDKLIT